MIDELINEYFEWLYSIVSIDEGSYPDSTSYRKLMMHLHSTEFTYSIYKDKNRASDGIDLRFRFAIHNGHENLQPITNYISGPCSVLEMMIALALRCEETIMDDPKYGDRTKQWFWNMINSLGLNSMYNREYDKNEVDDILNTFLNREYSSNGRGGLFTIENCKTDLTTVEIWCQLCWYLDNRMGY